MVLIVKHLESNPLAYPALENLKFKLNCVISNTLFTHNTSTETLYTTVANAEKDQSYERKQE